MVLLVTTQDRDFVETFIPAIMLNYITKKYSEKRAIKLNEYLSTVLGLKYTTKDIMVYAVKHLSVIDEKTHFKITEDKVAIMPGTRYNLTTLLKLIEFGTYDVRGYPLLSRAVEYIINHMGIVKSLYVRMRKRAKKNGN